VSDLDRLADDYSAMRRERDDAEDRARRACQILIAEIGADGPTDVDDVAKRAVEEIRRLRELQEESEHQMHLRIRSGYDKTVADSWRAKVAEVERERDEARRNLGEILAVIHRDGGHHTGEFGVSQSVADAHATWAAVVRERDDLKAKLDAELPAAWREDLASLNECLEWASRDLYEARSEIDHHKRQVLVSEAKHKEAARERDELKARLAHAEADAEQAIHNEAFMERQRIAEWLRTASRASGVLISIHSSQDIARCADAIERGEHEQ
jgi:hypothetical protein